MFALRVNRCFSQANKSNTVSCLAIWSGGMFFQHLLGHGDVIT